MIRVLTCQREFYAIATALFLRFRRYTSCTCNGLLADTLEEFLFLIRSLGVVTKVIDVCVREKERGKEGRGEKNRSAIKPITKHYTANAGYGYFISSFNITFARVSRCILQREVQRRREISRSSRRDHLETSFSRDAAFPSFRRFLRERSRARSRKSKVKAAIMLLGNRRQWKSRSVTAITTQHATLP